MRTAAGALLLVLATALPAGAESPTEDIQQYTERVLQLIQDARLREQDTLEALRAAVRRVAIQIFGAPEAAKGVLGRHWETLTPAERDDFTYLFAELLEATYIARMEHARAESGGSVRVHYVGELVEGDLADVRARVTSRRGRDMRVDARLVRRGGRWLVYDVLVEEVSLVGNYRAQFDRIIRKSGYAGLVDVVRAKRDELWQARRRAPTE